MLRSEQTVAAARLLLAAVALPKPLEMLVYVAVSVWDSGRTVLACEAMDGLGGCKTSWVGMYDVSIVGGCIYFRRKGASDLFSRIESATSC